ERADAGAVARQHQALAARVPERDRELAVEALDEAVAVAVVEVDDHLGVGAGAEGVALALQLLAQFEVVEDLAVEDGPDRPGAVVQRLLAGGRVDDRQSGVGQANAGGEVDSVGVGAAVAERRGHALQLATILRGGRRAARETGQSAHRQRLPAGPCAAAPPAGPLARPGTRSACGGVASVGIMDRCAAEAGDITAGTGARATGVPLVDTNGSGARGRTATCAGPAVGPQRTPAGGMASVAPGVRRRLVRIAAEVADDAPGAVRPACLAHVAAVQDQPVVRPEQVLLRYDPHQSVLDLAHVLARRQPGAV